MARVKYVGPHDSVDMDGHVVKRGEAVEVPHGLAVSLLEQATNWQKATGAKKTGPNQNEE